jgi:hypothetical protein
VPSGEFRLAIDGEVIRGVGAGEVVRGEVIVAILMEVTLSYGTPLVLLWHQISGDDPIASRLRSRSLAQCLNV